MCLRSIEITSISPSSQQLFFSQWEQYKVGRSASNPQYHSQEKKTSLKTSTQKKQLPEKINHCQNTQTAYSKTSKGGKYQKLLNKTNEAIGAQPLWYTVITAHAHIHPTVLLSEGQRLTGGLLWFQKFLQLHLHKIKRWMGHFLISGIQDLQLSGQHLFVLHP